MRRNLFIAVFYTIVTTLIFGMAYPLAVTGASRLLFKEKADGQLIYKNGQLVGSSLIGQPFSGDAYFHSRPSVAGTGYDAANSGGSNYAPTNKKLVDRISTDATAAAIDHPGQDVPIDLVTTSASGLDPHITPASAAFQIDRVAKARGMDAAALSKLVAKHTEGRQLGVLGEPRVNVLELNLELDQLAAEMKR